MKEKEIEVSPHPAVNWHIRTAYTLYILKYSIKAKINLTRPQNLVSRSALSRTSTESG